MSDLTIFQDSSSQLMGYPLSEFQDVNVMVVAGFGFFGTFLVRYGFSGSAFNLLVAVIATQWAIILNGFESWIQSRRILIDLKRYVFPLMSSCVPYWGRPWLEDDLKATLFSFLSLVFAEICTASALISIGTVIGKTNPVQLILIAILEVSGFILNGWLLRTFLEVSLCLSHLRFSSSSCKWEVLSTFL